MSRDPNHSDHDPVQPGDEDLASAFMRESEVIEEAEEGGKKIRRKGVYLLPNLFTTSALFSGFFAMVAAIDGDFTTASIAIFIAMVLDGLDGRVARLTNTQSDFGAEYDSLSDMLSFGVAPGLVAFIWILQDIGKTGWVVAFLYVACAALRLARFNVQIGSVDKKWFIGLPSPSAAALVAASVWTFHSFDADAFGFKLLMLFVVGAAGVLMVSNIRYYSFKDVDLKGPVPFVFLLAIVLGFVVISIEPSVMLLLLFGTYVASGPVMAVMRKLKRTPAAG
ncbi:CDP-diacylglycerol--serine O-phosphatidyltransferase [Halomonas aestuarii]|uniref:CDP-diacylglycerol--serine O-phosphatidyltransferase n=1 Tax=Halomonas aestuarii TaxID=1897729 RepID=A0A1J0VGK0_9GAMM|nr:CDP-diacylglycerol--serine O-phosphatidyltransferase [Halomonas aestuarii]APE31163.1 CDP-diacylglycerol--serine O-phosphatidyltransferase [Halomonas aestuarii]